MKVQNQYAMSLKWKVPRNNTLSRKHCTSVYFMETHELYSVGLGFPPG